MAKYYTGAERDENGEAIEEPSFFEKVKKNVKERFLFFIAGIVLTFGYMFLYEPKLKEAVQKDFIIVALSLILLFFLESVMETAWDELKILLKRRARLLEDGD